MQKDYEIVKKNEFGCRLVSFDNRNDLKQEFQKVSIQF